jgi:peroxiredoxin
VTVAALVLSVGAATAADLEELLFDMQIVPLDGERPHAFELASLDGRPVTLSEQKGKVVLLYFWATWCPYCAKELPSAIEQAYRERKDQGFTVLAVNIRESREKVAGWIKERGLTVPVVLDSDGEIISRYRVRATPTIVLIGRDGRMIGRAVGNRPWGTPAGRALLDALMAQPGR